jgi:hypothetical protein
VFTQPVTEMSTRNIPAGKALQERKADKHGIIRTRFRVSHSRPGRKVIGLAGPDHIKIDKYLII